MSLPRKSVLGEPVNDAELRKRLDEIRGIRPTDEQLTEQKVSFVYGNSPKDSHITKDSARRAVKSMLMRA